jgi:hypothetical protein
VGAQNIANAQKTGELPADRDPQMLAAELLSGVHAVASVALARTLRPPVLRLTARSWSPPLDNARAIWRPSLQ